MYRSVNYNADVFLSSIRPENTLPDCLDLNARKLAHVHRLHLHHKIDHAAEPSSGELVGELSALTFAIDGSIAFAQYSSTDDEPPGCSNEPIVELTHIFTKACRR